MTRFFNRFFNNPIIAGAVLVGVTYTGYNWWFANGEWGWFVAWLLVSVRTYNAIEAQRKEAEFNDYEIEKPRWYARFFGHPLIALPIAFCGLFVAIYGGYQRHFVNHGLFDGAALFEIMLFVVPVLLCLRWVEIRQAWLNLHRTPDDQKTEMRKPKTVPVAAIVTPTVSLGAPAIPEAMQRLPSSLLELVRDGAQATRATMQA